MNHYVTQQVSMFYHAAKLIYVCGTTHTLLGLLRSKLSRTSQACVAHFCHSVLYQFLATPLSLFPWNTILRRIMPMEAWEDCPSNNRHLSAPLKRLRERYRRSYNAFWDTDWDYSFRNTRTYNRGKSSTPGRLGSCSWWRAVHVANEANNAFRVEEYDSYLLKEADLLSRCWVFGRLAFIHSCRRVLWMRLRANTQP